MMNNDEKITVVWEMPFDSSWQVVAIKKAPQGRMRVCLESGIFEHQATLCYLPEHFSVAVVRRMQIESLLRTGSCVFGTPGAVIRYTSSGRLEIRRNTD